MSKAPSRWSWRTFAVYGVVGPLLGTVLPAVVTVGILTHDYAGPLWTGTTAEWVSLIGSATLSGLVPAVLTALAVAFLPPRPTTRLGSLARGAVFYGLLTAIMAVAFVPSLRALGGANDFYVYAIAVLVAAGVLAGLCCAAIASRWTWPSASRASPA